MKKRSQIIFFALLLLSTLPATRSLAQPGDPNGGGTPGDVPITGIEWLLAAGGVLGAKKLYGLRKRKQI